MSWAMIGAAVASAVVGNLLAPSPAKAPDAPAVTPPKAMPTPGDASDKAAKRLSLKQQRDRQGRASTILTDASATTDKLGA